MRRPRLPDRFRAHRLPQDRAGVRHRAPDGLTEASKFAEPLFTPASKAELGQHDENITFDQVVDLVGAERAGAAAGPHPADLLAGRRARADQGNHHRRHQVRVRRRRTRHGGAGRRGLHPRLVAVLAGRRLPGGRRAAEFRQAVRPQLAHRAGFRLGPRRATNRRRPCRPTSPRPPARGTSKPTNAFRA